MSTTKTMKKAASHASKGSAVKAKPKAPEGRRGRGGANLRGRSASLVVPTAAALGTGALVAGAFILREELAELMHAAVDGMRMTRRIAYPRLLAFAGLKPRRSFLSAAMPEVAGLAIGLVSGAALTLWLAPKIGEGIDSSPIIAGRGDTPGTDHSTSTFEPSIHVAP